MPIFVIRNIDSTKYVTMASGFRHGDGYFRFFDDFGNTVFRISDTLVLEVASEDEHSSPAATSQEESTRIWEPRATLVTGLRPTRPRMSRSWFV